MVLLILMLIIFTFLFFRANVANSKSGKNSDKYGKPVFLNIGLFAFWVKLGANNCRYCSSH